MEGRRVVVTGFAGVSAAIAGLVGAVSLTRIAGDYLGFPPGLEWTFTGAVDVAGVAGGVMWTGWSGKVRRIGQALNVVCTLISGVGVGLDHATNAGRKLDGHVVSGAAGQVPWPWVAGAVGVLLPLLFTTLVHALAVIRDLDAPATSWRMPGWTRRLGSYVKRKVRRPSAAEPSKVLAGVRGDSERTGGPSPSVPSREVAAPVEAEPTVTVSLPAVSAPQPSPSGSTSLGGEGVRLRSVPQPVESQTDGKPARFAEAVAFSIEQNAGAKRLMSEFGLSEHHAKQARREAQKAV